MERIKAFPNTTKHWSETLHDPSQEIKTEYGRLFVYQHRINNIKYDGFRPKSSLLFPYGLSNISQGGELPQMHMYFAASLDEKIKKSHEREHLVLKVYLPKIDVPYIAYDTFQYGGEHREFVLFMREGEKEHVDKEGDFIAISPTTTGLLTIPDAISLTSSIEISLQQIPKGMWERTPWSSTDAFREAEISLYRSWEEDRKRFRPPEGDMIIGSMK